MFSKILIANRGEIAVRIIRACRELGIKTVAVYSEADREALHTQLADEAVCIGTAKVSDSYLNIQNILSAAIVTGAEAIHPGFGFLSENSKFASICSECQLTFIGPPTEIINGMGDKMNARNTMLAAGIPVIPGSQRNIRTLAEAKKTAEGLGYPVMLKAVSGGGGKGIRKIHSGEEMEKNFTAAKKEAAAAFGDDEMYLEKVIYPARHIEVQVLGDKFGTILHLGERDCSLQRNNQKLIEETPAAHLTADKQEELYDLALRAAKAVSYESVGTIEFLIDKKSQEIYFMEMNTRIQVEHPVTEMLTGIDLIKEQICIAYGHKLSIQQSDVVFTGHALECRINAENPENNFAPSCGKIQTLLLPSGGLGLRVDNAIYQGYDIPPFYDSMLAKVIVHGKNRKEALMKMNRALSEFVIEGVKTNKDYQLALINHPDIVNGNYTTAFINECSIDNQTVK
ncbi:acetyl-CoA carboxylase biotin carboxylase subunit [Enterococcus sp. LJL98]